MATFKQAPRTADRRIKRVAAKADTAKATSNRKGAKRGPADEPIAQFSLKFHKGNTERTVSRKVLRALAETKGVTETALIHELLAHLRD